MSLRSLIALPGRSTSRRSERTTTNHLNPVIYKDSQDRIFATEFYTPTPIGAWFAKQTFPGKIPDKAEETSYWFPPPHYHLLQDEHFKVKSGEGYWTLYGGKKVHLKKGDGIVIPARSWHTFEKVEGTEEPFSVLYKYDAEYAEMEEQFFRNTFGYFEDCRKAGVQPSIFQVAVFLVHCWMPIGLPQFGPEWLNMVLSTIFTLVLGFIGQFILGYKASYPEYYDKESKKSK